MTVAAEIKALARELGISQKVLSEKAHIGRASLSLKLNGRRDMKLSEVERLAAVLGTTHKDLIERAEWSAALAGISPDRYEIKDLKSGSIILQARRVDGDGGDAEGGL